MPITFEQENGPRTHQDDKYLSTHIIKGTINGDVLAVMDGHGGDEVSHLCYVRIPQLVKSIAGETPEEILKNIISELSEEAKTFSAGSTISMVFIDYTSSRCFVAVLGDSPVFTLSESGCSSLSPIHNVKFNEKERKLAIDRGGVYRDGYIKLHDSKYMLQLSRALGNSELDSIISNEPEIYVVDNPMWILLATDGLFHGGYVDNDIEEELSDFASNFATAHDIMNWSKSHELNDNATAVVWQR